MPKREDGFGGFVPLDKNSAITMVSYLIENNGSFDAVVNISMRDGYLVSFHMKTHDPTTLGLSTKQVARRGAQARAKSLSAQERKDIAQKAAAARWGNQNEGE